MADGAASDVAGRLPDRAGALQALAAQLRRPRGHAGHGRARRTAGSGPATSSSSTPTTWASTSSWPTPSSGCASSTRRCGAVVLTVGQGARLLRRRQHPHAGPVLARLEGELLQVHQRDAQLRSRRPRRESGQKWLAAVNGPCAGGGYELALACERIVMADDGNTVGGAARGAAAGRAARHRRPHPPGRQAQGPPRPRRLLLHARGGHQGQARGGVEPGRRGRAALASWTRRVRQRATELAARSDRPAGARGIALTPLERTHRAATAIAYRYVTLRDRPASRHRRDHRGARPTAPPPADAAGVHAQGAAFWPLAAGPRARRPAPAPAHQRGRDRPLGAPDDRARPTWSRPTTGCSSSTRRTGWCARSGSTCARVLKRARRDLALASSRSSSRARASPARCSSWPWPPTARYMLDGAARRRRPRRRRRRLTARTSAPIRWSTASRAWPAASCGEPGRVDDLQGAGRPGPRRRRRRRGGPGHLHARRHRLGRRGAHRDRGARRVLARRAHRHGGQPALRRARRRWRPRSSAACRPGRTGSSSARTRWASKGALHVYGTGSAPSSTRRRV